MASKALPQQGVLRQCTHCSETKPLEDYPFNKGYFLWRCKKCWEKRFNETFRSDPEWQAKDKAWREKYNSDGRRKNTPFEINGERNKRYPEKSRARRILRDAISRGEVIRPLTCENCGNGGVGRDGRSTIQGHHDDYNSPLDVKWLCTTCHAAMHRELNRQRGNE